MQVLLMHYGCWQFIVQTKPEQPDEEATYKGKLDLQLHTDFATNRDDRVSMGGFITFIDETPISWRTFKQKSVSLSTMEAEGREQLVGNATAGCITILDLKISFTILEDGSNRMSLVMLLFELIVFIAPVSSRVTL
ncbi:hypothetical protein TNCV_2134651 [Trichonephila clavipes]|nr:hypothetical protein TNCV_2134651 [Trichonephila clavipes]